MQTLITSILSLKVENFISPNTAHFAARFYRLEQLRGGQTPLQVGDVPLQVDEGLAVLLQAVLQLLVGAGGGVVVLAGPAVPDHQVQH